jgi:hypothetical protein
VATGAGRGGLDARADVPLGVSKATVSTDEIQIETLVNSEVSDPENTQGRRLLNRRCRQNLRRSKLWCVARQRQWLRCRTANPHDLNRG